MTFINLMPIKQKALLWEIDEYGFLDFTITRV